MLENLALSNTRGEVPDGEHVAEIGRAAVLKPGRDITLIGYSRAAVIALEVARRLGNDGDLAEVIDLCSLRPLDLETVCASVRKTSRAVIVEDDRLSAGSARRSPPLFRRARSTTSTPRTGVSRHRGVAPYAEPRSRGLARRRGADRVIRESLDATRLARRRGHARSAHAPAAGVHGRGTLSQGAKHEGDQIRRADILAVIKTDKAVMEWRPRRGYPPASSPQWARLQPLPTGSGLCRRRGSRLGTPARRAGASCGAGPPAREHGIDLTVVSGTGPDGRISRADIEDAVASAAAISRRRRRPRNPPGAARPCQSAALRRCAFACTRLLSRCAAACPRGGR